MAGWVCPECGIDYDTISPSDAVTALRSFPRRYREVVTGPPGDDAHDDVIRRRPEPSVWSAVEYTVHVADVLDELARALERIHTETDPKIEGDGDPDELAVSRAYNERAVDDALAALEAGADRAAKAVERFSGEEWHRTGQFSYGERDALTMARNAVHEGSHHLRDVKRVLDRVR